MKIGYPSINLTLSKEDEELLFVIGRKPDQMWAAVAARLSNLMDILEFNVQHRIHFFRIQNDLVPYARTLPDSFDWRGLFDEELEAIGAFIRDHHIRVTIHPDLDVMLNHPNRRVRKEALADLSYQCELLDALGVDETAKVQIHAGDRFGDIPKAMGHFIDAVKELPPEITRRLAVENETVMCDLSRCLTIHEETGLPIVFDVLHHSIKNGGEPVEEALQRARGTWRDEDGLPMVDYSAQAPNKMPGKHGKSLDEEDFRRFMAAAGDLDFDLMLEQKDREHSALQVVELMEGDPRFVRGLTSAPGK